MTRQDEIQNKRECHKCPYNGNGGPDGTYCWMRCLGPSDKSNKGKSFVRLGAIEAQGEYLFTNADNLITDKAKTNEGIEDLDLSSPTEETEKEDYDNGESVDPDSVSNEDDITASPSFGVTENLNYNVERALVLILANLMSLSDTQLCIFRHVFHGQDMKKIGATLPVPISKQAVFKHLLAMTKANPVVEKVIHQMMREGHGGAKKQVKQLELFEAMGLEV